MTKRRGPEEPEEDAGSLFGAMGRAFEALCFDPIRADTPKEVIEHSTAIARAYEHFRADGPIFDPKHDSARLGAQMASVLGFLIGRREWHTLAEMRLALGYPEASISARIRDCRKKRFGSYTVERRRRGDPKLGLFEYRIPPSASSAPPAREGGV